MPPLAEASALEASTPTCPARSAANRPASPRNSPRSRRRPGPGPPRRARPPVVLGVSSGGSSASGGLRPCRAPGGNGIVSVRGIRVDSSIAGALESMLAAAAADGIVLSGGGFRDPAGQIAVRKSTAAPPATPSTRCPPRRAARRLPGPVSSHARTGPGHRLHPERPHPHPVQLGLTAG